MLHLQQVPAAMLLNALEKVWAEKRARWREKNGGSRAAAHPQGCKGGSHARTIKSTGSSGRPRLHAAVEAMGRGRSRLHCVGVH